MSGSMPITQEKAAEPAAPNPEERRRRLRAIQLPAERKLINHPDFEIAWPEKVSVVGFAVITLLCAVIVLSTWFLGKWLAGL